jgi:hypothetical protein
MSFVPGGNVYDVFVTGGTGVQSVNAGTGISSTGGNNPIVGNTGVVSVTAGAGISTDFPQGNITITNTGVQGVTAGTGIAIDNTNPQNPVISSTDVSSVTAGAGISVTGSPSTPTVANTGVLSLIATAPLNVSAATGVITLKNNGIVGVTAGTGISVGSGQNPVITNTGVTGITAGTGITSTGGTNPTIANNGVLTVSTPSGSGITIGGTTQNPQVVNAGVLGLTAGTNISITGSSQNPVINYTGSTGDDNFFAGWSGSAKQPSPAWASSGGTFLLNQFLLEGSFYNGSGTPPGIPTIDPLWIRASVPNPFGNAFASGNTLCYATLGYFNGAEFIEHPSAIPYRNYFTVPNGTTSLSNITALTVEGLAPPYLSGQTVTITATNGFFQFSQEVVSPPPPVQPFIRFSRGQIPPGTYNVSQLQNLIQTALQSAINTSQFTDGTNPYKPTVSVTVTSMTPLTYSVAFSSYFPLPAPNSTQLVTFDATVGGGSLLTAQQSADSTALFGWGSFTPIPSTIQGNLPPNGTSTTDFTIGLVATTGTATVQAVPQFISYSARPVNTQW